MQQLDHMLSPMPPGATLLLLNDPGVEAEPFLYQAAHSHLVEGGTVVYATANRAPATVTAAMADYGFDPGPHAGRLVFLDAFSSLMGSRGDATYAVDDPANLEKVALALERAAREHSDAVLLVDALSTFLDHAPPEAFAAALPRMHRAMKRFRMAAALFTRWPYGLDLEDLLAPFDSVVTLRGVEERVMFRQYFAVERAAWTGNVDAKPRLYRAMKPGGVYVYIPKVLVTGPHNAGKSCFIHAVSDTSASADYGGTTVALDHGHVTVDGLTADLFGTPGQSRFDPILKTLAAQALGVIVVVDATDPDTFPRAREMMQQTWQHGLPAIIAANKQDQPGALAPEVVASLLGVPPHVKVVGCTGKDPASARRVLRELIDQILERSVTR